METTTTPKKLTKKQRAIKSLCDKPEAAQEDYKGFTIITHAPHCVAYYMPRQRGYKPASYTRYRNAEEAAEQVAYIKKQADREQERTDRAKAEAAAELEKIQEGSIMVSSWGHEQTNVDFYLVISRRNTAVTLQQIGSTKVTEGQLMEDRGKCLPNQSVKHGEPFKKRLNQFAAVKLTTYSFARLWDGSPKYWSSYA